MRLCEYCGHQNGDQAARCTNCANGLPVSTRLLRNLDPSSGPPIDQPQPQIPLSMRQRVGMWVGAWLAAGAAMALLEWSLAVFNPVQILWFPLGLFMFLGRLLAPLLILPVGWAYYVALTVAALRANHRTRYYVLYAVLCVSLALNCAGCHSLWHANVRE